MVVQFWQVQKIILEKADHRQKLAREMGVLGLPITMIIDPEGNEIARMIGDAEWNGESAKAIICILIGQSKEG